MEVRTIKTCEGWKQVQFLDGALLSETLDLREVSSIERTDYLDLRYWVRLPVHPCASFQVVFLEPIR